LIDLLLFFSSWQVHLDEFFALHCGLRYNVSIVFIVINIFAGMAWKAKTKGNSGREIEVPSLEG